MANLTPELEKARQVIEKMARGYGLDFFEVIFELITYDQMNQFAAYTGFPVRYPHWRFGMDYEQISKGYEWGLSKIYEMVINTDPSYAYLMEGNMFVDQKLVMAHVFGHVDFFKNNKWFEPTNRKMMDQMANHATRIQRYIDRFGHEKVEDFIDCCLSIENLIDRYSVYKKPNNTPLESAPQGLNLLKSEKGYMDKFINPPDFVQDQIRKAREENEKTGSFPEKPERDVLQFLLKYAPLAPWQQDVLSIIRDEAYYFAPQGMTKIMNEGWASYWHSTMMTQGILTDSEVIDYADHHSGTMAMSPQRFNPYKVGLELLRHVEDRWNKGRFGKDWDECDSFTDRKNWDKKTGLGRQKIFEIRRDYNDVTFIDTFMDEDFCVQNKLFVYKFNKSTGKYEIDTREFKKTKAQLLFQLTNWGQPIIDVVDGNFENKGELLLRHMYEGIDMQPDFMSETMSRLFNLWTRPVNLLTVLEGEQKLCRFDGKEFKEFTLKELPKGAEPA
ncbi:MAG: SpoVR family protein [Bdellovibrionales bacterium]|nr:SpoVR family protein [Bdellovibrionales bacterium]